jgi:hypothetical protein
MASGSSQQPSQEPPRGASAGAGEGCWEEPPGEERLGPLAILRTRKPDGRALMLYSRVEHDDSGSGANEPA